MRREEKPATAAGLLPILLILLTCGSRDVTEEVIQFHGHDQFEQNEESALREVVSRMPDLLGDPADEAEWPGAVFVRPPRNGGVCSANLMGPRVVLTAAHCLRPGDKIAVDGVSGTCEEPPGVSDCPSGPDIALCLLERDVHRASYETIPQTTGWARIGASVQLVGRGLNTPVAMLDLVLRQGAAEVIQPPDATTGYLTIQGQAAACSGDSGGGAFLNLGTGRRVLAGVISTHLTCASNQRIDITDLSSEASLSFVRDWAGRHPEARICGLHADTPRCHP